MARPTRTTVRRTSASDDPQTGMRRVIKETERAPLVLLVDDAEDARHLYAGFLANAGLRVAQAADGGHALWKVGTLLPNVVVMDLLMPVLDGWEATRKIKAHPKTKHVAVIVLSGHADEAELQRAVEAGADVLLTKPCSPEVLLAAVRRLVDR